jgi:hypothetical protein
MPGSGLGMVRGMGTTHPNSLAALERHRPYGLAPWVPKCGVRKRNGEPCRAACVKGKSRCFHHGAAAGTRARTPFRLAARALKRAERLGLIPVELKTHPAWIRAHERRSANVGARLALLSAWGTGDVEAWARAVQAVS